jgi:hypothetical protein
MGKGRLINNNLDIVINLKIELSFISTSNHSPCRPAWPGTSYVAHVGFKLMVLPSQPPKY